MRAVLFNWLNKFLTGDLSARIKSWNNQRTYLAKNRLAYVRNMHDENSRPESQRASQHEHASRGILEKRLIPVPLINPAQIREKVPKYQHANHQHNRGAN